MISLSLEVNELITCTTAMLSEIRRIHLLARRGPQVLRAITIGYSSRTVETLTLVVPCTSEPMTAKQPCISNRSR